MTHLDSGGITLYILNLVAPLDQLGCKTHIFSSGGELQDLFTSAGAPVTKSSIRTKSELDPKLYFALPSLVRLLKKEKFDLIHAHNRPAQVLAHWAGKQAKIPYVTTCHGFYKRRLGRRLLPAWGDLTIAISPGVADHLHHDFKVDPKKIRVVPNGVDVVSLRKAGLNQTAAKAQFGWSHENLVIGCIARLVKVKGQADLIEAFRLLSEKHPEARLLLAGDGEEREEYEKLVSASGLRDKILFTGNLRDITPVLAAMDVFVHPATWEEAFGLSIIEAMVYGKPVVVTDTWALKNSFRDGESVFLVPPSNAQVLSQVLIRLLKSPHLRSDAGSKGQKIAEQQFSLDRCAASILQVYKEALTVPSS